MGKNSLKEAFEQNGYVWIGDYIPCTKEQLQENQLTIIKITEMVAKSFIKVNSRFNIDYSDLYDYVLDIIVNRCGNLFINKTSEESLNKVLYTYLMKYCYGILFNRNNLDYEKISNLKEYSSQDFYQEDFIQNYSFLTSEEQYFLQTVSQYIELGEDYVGMLKKEWNLTDQEIKEKMIVIKEKITNSDYLSSIGKVKYLKK